MKIKKKQLNNFHSAPKKEIGYNLEDEKKRIAEGTEEMKLELWEEWKKTYANSEVFPPAIASLNPQARDVLLSFENTLLYNSLAEKFKLTQEQRDKLPKIVWQICLEGDYDALQKSLQSNLGSSSEIIEQISDSISQKILSKITAPQPMQTKDLNPTNQTSEVKPIQMKLVDASKRISGFGDQLITSEIIQIKNSSEKARPSIKNWLTDYHFNLGNEKHNSMQRSAYLFRSPISKKLSSIDRQKLSFILKADDEESLLNIDPETQKIIFPKFKDNPPRKVISTKKTPVSLGKKNIPHKLAKPAFNFPQKKEVTPKSSPANNSTTSTHSNIQNESFSSPQKMMSEKKSAPQQTEKISTPQSKAAPKSLPTKKALSFSEEVSALKESKRQSVKNPKDNLVNVVDLKDLV